MKKVSDEDFVVAWVTADTLQNVINATGLTKQGCAYRVKKLRELGVQLMDLPGINKKEQHVKYLNRLVTKYSRRDRNGNIRIQ